MKKCICIVWDYPVNKYEVKTPSRFGRRFYYYALNLDNLQGDIDRFSEDSMNSIQLKCCFLSFNQAYFIEKSHMFQGKLCHYVHVNKLNGNKI